jgi:hypothetical protein
LVWQISLIVQILTTEGIVSLLANYLTTQSSAAGLGRMQCFRPDPRLQQSVSRYRSGSPLAMADKGFIRWRVPPPARHMLDNFL